MPQLGPNLRVFQGFGDVQNALLSGQVPVAVVLSFRAFADEALGAPIKTVEPTDGEFLLGDAAAINTDAKSPNAARLFMNFLLEKRAQDILSKAYMYPVTEEVAPQDGVPALDDLKGVQPDVASLADPKVVLEVKKSFKSATNK